MADAKLRGKARAKQTDPDYDPTVALRVPKDRLAAWEAAAAADGRKLSDWIRRRVDGLPTTAPAASDENVRAI